MNLSTAVRSALGMDEGYILPWEWFHGCQMMSRSYRAALSCPEREAVWRCEVIGPHTRHRWSDHLIAHERYGNGHSCRTVGASDETLASSLSRLYPWSRIAAHREPWRTDHAFEGDGPHCVAWIEGQMGGGDAGTIVYRVGCGYPRDAHGPA